MPSYLNNILGHLANGATTVTATRRLSRYLLHQYDHRRRQEGAAAWATPHTLSWGDWIGFEWRRLSRAVPRAGRVTVMDESQELALWERVIARANARRRNGAMLQVPAAARSARDARRLLNDWCIDTADVEAAAGEDTREFLRWLAEFEQALGAGQWRCEYELPGLLGGYLADCEWKPEGTLVFAGFDQWAPAWRNLVRSMQGAKVALEIADPPEDPGKSCRLVCCESRRCEFEAAAEWARDLLLAGESGAIGVVVDDLAAERGLVESIFDQVLHQGESLEQTQDGKKSFHVSIGRPLSDYPLVSAALTLLEFIHGGARPVRDLARLLQSPFVCGGMEFSGMNARLAFDLHRGGRPEAGLSDVLRLLEKEGKRSSVLGKGIAGAVRETARPPRSPAVWAESFVAWLEQFGWPGERTLDSVEYQAVEAWRDLLSRFARLNLVAPVMDAPDAVDTLRRMADARIFQEREHPAPVQIVGVAESSGMRFSHLWISGMTEDAWPPAGNPNPFIPFALQRRLGLPGTGTESDLERYEGVSRRLLASADTVTVSFARGDSDQSGRPSPLFRSDGQQTVDAGHAGLTARIREGSPSFERIHDTSGPVLDAGSLEGGASVFGDQSACPFRAFARHRLAIVDAPRLEPGLDASTRGSLLHECMAEVWRDIGSSRALGALDGNGVSQVVDGAVGTVVGRFGARRGASFEARLLGLERARLSALVQSWLCVERERQPFQIAAIEQRVTAKIDGLELTLRLDRVDETEDGSRVVIDYKTGAKADPGQWLGDRPEEPQLPLYLLALESEGIDVGGLAFAHLRIGANRFAGLGHEPAFGHGMTEPEDWTGLKKHWAEVLHTLLKQYRGGEAKVDPRNAKVCEYCQVKPLCRVFDPLEPASGHDDS